MKTLAAVFHSPGIPFDVRSVDLEAPKSGEVLVEIKAVGVCHSDWHLMTGATNHPLPAVVGHEGAGIVHSVGPAVSGIAPGQHISLSWAPNCGECYYCSHGRPSLCEAYLAAIWAGTMLDGTTRLSLNGQPLYHYCSLACFAEYAVVPQQCCVPMPDTIPFRVAAVVGCAVATGVGSVMNTARVEKGSIVAVYGAGGVGLSTIMGAQLAGASVIVAIDPFQSRREAAMGLGATHAAPTGAGAIQAIRDLSEGRGADYVFDASGVPSAQEESLRAARPGGTVVFSGLSPMGSATNLPGAEIVREEKTIKGSYYGTCDPSRDFPLFAQLYREGRLPLDRLVSKTYNLSEINQAYKDMLDGAVVRGVVLF